MWEMARCTALSLDGRVLVDEWPCGLNVTLGADDILGRTNTEQIRLEGAMWIVAIGAFDQPFVDPVVKWLRKSRLDICMALIAKARLALLEQGRLRFELVDAVAAGATDKSFAMGGPLEVGVVTNMASQTLLLHLSRRCLCELEDLGRHSAAVNMGLAGSVTAFACDPFAVVLESESGMRIVVGAFHLVLMANGAGFCAGVVSWIYCGF